jgi:O-methyltransferase domain/Dimerisation domain
VGKTVPSDLTGPTETATLMMRLLAGAWTARVIHAAAELGLADHFSENASDAASLAAVTDTHPPSLARLLRALAAIGIVHEDEKRRYTLTPLGTMLRTDEPGSMRAWARVILGDELDRAWQALPHAIRTGENTFYNVFGTDLWSYFSTHLDRSNLLNAAMQSLTQGVNAAVGTHYPFGNFGWVVDVGGGDGALLLPILARQPAMRGTIFELPHVAAAARERIAAAGLTSPLRCGRRECPRRDPAWCRCLCAETCNSRAQGCRGYCHSSQLPRRHAAAATRAGCGESAAGRGSAALSSASTA